MAVEVLNAAPWVEVDTGSVVNFYTGGQQVRSETAFNNVDRYLFKDLGVGGQYAAGDDFELHLLLYPKILGVSATEPWAGLTLSDNATMATADAITGNVIQIRPRRVSSSTASYQYVFIINGVVEAYVTNVDLAGAGSSVYRKWHRHKLIRSGGTLTWEVWTVDGSFADVALAYTFSIANSNVVRSMYVEHGHNTGTSNIYQTTYTYMVEWVPPAGAPPTVTVSDKRTDATVNSVEERTIGLADYEVRARSEATKDAVVLITGDYANDSGAPAVHPTYIQARVVKDGTGTEVVPWTTIDNAPDTVNLTFGGTLTVPEGGWYNIQVRWENNTQSDYVGVAKWGVGVLVGIAGQSQGVHMEATTVNAGTLDPSALVGVYTTQVGSGPVGNAWGNAPAGTGHIRLLNNLWHTYKVPIGIINGCLGGTALNNVTASQYWLDTAGGSLWSLFKSAVMKAGGALSCLVWMQGEEDATVANQYGNYMTGLDTFFNGVGYVRDSFGASTPVLITSLGRRTDGVAANYDAIRRAQFDYVDSDANAFMAAMTMDLQLQDTVHYHGNAFDDLADRIWLTVNYVLGEGKYYRGPRPVGYRQVDATTVEIYLRNEDGYSLDFDGTSTWIDVQDDGLGVGIASLVLSGNVLTANLSTSIAGVLGVQVMYGSNPAAVVYTFTNGVLNGLPRAHRSVKLPVEFVGGVPAARYISETIYDRSGVARPNLTGLRWWAFETVTPGDGERLIDFGTGATTDGAGLFSVPLVECNLSAGAEVMLTVADATGTEIGTKKAVLV